MPKFSQEYTHPVANIIGWIDCPDVGKTVRTSTVAANRLKAAEIFASHHPKCQVCGDLYIRLKPNTRV